MRHADVGEDATHARLGRPQGGDRHEPEFLAEWDDAITQVEHETGAEPFTELIA